MTVRVDVQAYDDLDQALEAFNYKVSRDSDKRWYKKRFGYYEKPSRLKFKKEKMQSLSSYGCRNLWLKIGLAQQFERTSPVAMGK